MYAKDFKLGKTPFGPLFRGYSKEVVFMGEKFVKDEQIKSLFPERMVQRSNTVSVSSDMIRSMQLAYEENSPVTFLEYSTNANSMLIAQRELDGKKVEVSWAYGTSFILTVNSRSDGAENYKDHPGVYHMIGALCFAKEAEEFQNFVDSEFKTLCGMDSSAMSTKEAIYAFAEKLYYDARDCNREYVLRVAMDNAFIADAKEVSFVIQKNKRIKKPSAKISVPKMLGFSEEALKKVPHLGLNIKDNRIYAAAMQVSTGTAIAHIEYGPTGTGKTTNCKIICELIGLPIKSVINCTNALDSLVLGKFVPEEERFIFKESDFTEAFRNGGAVILEEINFGEPRYLCFLNNALDDNAQIELDNGETVKRHPNFRLFATMNPGYAGVCEMNPALLRRFGSKLLVENIPWDGIREKNNATKKTWDALINLYEKLQIQINNEDWDMILSPRKVITYTKLVNMGFSEKEAAEVTLKMWAKDDIDLQEYLQRDIIETYLAKDFGNKKSPKKTTSYEAFDGIEFSEDLEIFAEYLKNGGISCLFYGPTGTGKSTAVRRIAKAIGLPVKACINCTNSLDEFVLGKYVPKGNGFYFKESAVTEAVRNGGVVVFEEINFANPKHLSFLNSLLDDNGFIRLDSGETVMRHPDFKFFATMNPGYTGTCDLNAALYDRFEVGRYIPELTGSDVTTRLENKFKYIVPDEIFVKSGYLYDAISKILSDEQRTDIVITYSDIETFVQNIAVGLDAEMAAELSIVNIAMEDKELRAKIAKIVEAF